MTIKFCTKCGKKFQAVGREVICPACKAAAAEETKRAAVLKAKRASWAGESVPVRISGRASTVIREFGSVNAMTFAESLDYLLKASNYFKSTGRNWEEVTPYRSHRRDKATSTAETENTASTPQDGAQTPQDGAQTPQDGAQTASKPQTSKPQASKTTSTASTASKTASKRASSKPSKSVKE